MRTRNARYSAEADERETCRAGLLAAAAGHTEHQAPWCDDDGLVASPEAAVQDQCEWQIEWQTALV